MKVCYFDESGTGEEPIAVVVGVVVDSQRMHVTKDHWAELLEELSNVTGRRLAELHTKDFYSGAGPFRGLPGPKRAEYISAIMEWFRDRKHDFVFSAVDKKGFVAAAKAGEIPDELKSPWIAAAFHCVLALQRAHQRHEKTKGHTLLVFDNKGHEELPLTRLVLSPPEWTDDYYGRGKKQPPLSHIVDAPFFADSQHVPLLQVADFFAYFLRRHGEIAEQLVPSRYADEEEKIEAWVKELAGRCIGLEHLYPHRGRCEIAEVFYRHCPRSLRTLGR